MDPTKITLTSITEFLEKTCGLTRTTITGDSSLRAPAAKGCTRYFVVNAEPGRFRLRVDGHLEIELDCLVVDGRLGSLGLVRVLSDTAAAADNKNLLSFIEEAAYLRHVLDAKRAQAPEPEKLLPYAVEVVFVEPRGTGTSAADLGEALRESLRFTALPHALSVGFAHLANATDPLQRTQLLRRAFCWLLPGTEAWLKALKHIPASDVSNGGHVGWDTLELENFRRPSTRRWMKNPSAIFHVLHGPNGSGKSSLAEAFEFAVTGWAARLGDKPVNPSGLLPEHFAPLIWRTGSTPAAGAPLSAAVRLLHGKTERDRRSTTSGPADSLPRTLHADSFRLDQKLGDRLIDTTTRDRRWLEIFFKDFDDQLQLRRAAQQRLDTAIAHLAFARRPASAAASAPAPTPSPPTTATTPDVIALARTGEKTALSLLQFLDAIPGAMNSSDLQFLSGLELELPEVLRLTFRFQGDDIVDFTPLREKLVQALEHDAAKFAQWAPFTNDKFDGLLADVGKDFFGEQVTPLHDRGTTFNRWLRQVALVDLLEKSFVVAVTKTHLGTETSPTDEEWADTSALLDAIVPRATAEDLERRLNTARTERDQLRGQLSSLEAATQRSATGHQAGQPRQLSARELQPIFQAVQAGLFGHLIMPNNVDECADAIHARRKTKIRELSIGETEWTSPLREAMKSRRRAREILGPHIPAPGHTEEKADALLAVVTASRALARMESTAAGKFQEQVERGPLGTALEELLALFTPARWAYAAVETKVDVFGTASAVKGASLEFKTRGLDATKILNTAELNTLSLALYLLCAPRVENPFRVIFLDDPLQNMDELTVTTVARGLARLMRLWLGDDRLKDWSLVMLLNGEGNCERMVREAPAARYQFPWLAPVGASHAPPMANGALDDSIGPEDVVALPGSAEGALQSLEGLMEVVVAR